LSSWVGQVCVFVNGEEVVVGQGRNVKNDHDIATFAKVRNVQLEIILGLSGKEFIVVGLSHFYDRLVKSVELSKVEEFNRKALVLELLDGV
jgi:hypothetical protein